MRSEHPTLRAALTLALTFTMLWGGMPVPALAEVAEEVIEVTEEAAAESEDASPGDIEEVGASETGEVNADELLEEDSADVDEADTEPLESEEEAAIEEAGPEAVEEGAEEPGAESADEVAVLEAQSATVADPRVVADSSMEAGQKTTWDCVWLGSYPQSVVTDAATIAALDAAAGWSASGDLAYGGATYRRLREADATCSGTFSGYWDWGQASSAGYCYFRWEPIKWRVLEADGSTALVLSDMALNDQRYNDRSTDVTWETCGLRSWLNQTFWGDALTSAQQAAVALQTLANDDNIFYGTTGGNVTMDNVFLLAESDVWSTDVAARHGFAKAYGIYDEARRCKASDFALSMGSCDYSGESYGGSCWWWLRSPGSNSEGCDNSAVNVLDSGFVSRHGNLVDLDDNAVRPALRISLSSNQISYAGTVSSDGTVNEQAAPYSGTPGGGAGQAEQGKYTLHTTDYKEITGEFDEAWFTEGDAYKYNHTLGTTASILASSVYKQRSIQKDLATLGFERGAYWFPKEVSDYDGYGTDSVGYQFGIKKLPDGTPLVAVLVRGTTKNIEWQSNFNIADTTFPNDYHEGFKLASDGVMGALKSYIAELTFDEDWAGIDLSNAKFLVTGHSRGAAVANLVARDLDDGKLSLASHGQSQPENVFAYTFATPAVASRTDVVNARYTNIFNIVNPEDAVPMVPLAKWAYGRYGVNKVLPSKSNMGGKRYKKLLGRMRGVFATINKKGDEYTPYKNGSQTAEFLADMIYSACPTVYRVYEGFSVPGLGIVSSDSINMSSVFHSLGDFLGEGSNVAGNAVNVLSDLAVMHPVLCNAIWHAYFEVASGQVAAPTTVALIAAIKKGLEVGDCFTNAHQSETYIAWMKAGTDDELFGGDRTYRGIRVACPVDVRVYDGDGVLVCSITDGVVDESVMENGLAASVVGDIKMVDIPSDEPYRVEIEATADGTMDVSCSEVGPNGTVTKQVSYADVPLVQGDVYEGDFAAAGEDMGLLAPDGSEVEVSTVATGEQVNSVSVSVSVAEGDGSADGNALASPGQPVTVFATPADGAEFLGWYCGDNLVGEQAAYTFRADASVELGARFSKTICLAEVDDIIAQSYTGSSIKPPILVSRQGSPLAEGTDYEVSYSDNVMPGTATATITGIGDYTGSKTASFHITCPASKLSVSAPDQTYTGRALEPAPTVKLGGMTLAAGTDYSVSYKNNTNAGTATVIVTGRGDYTGTVTCTFSIARAKVSVPKATNRTYNGKAQTGVAAGVGYKLSGTAKATNAGTYTATATPDANHCWTDGTTAAKALKWSIAKVALSISLADQTKTYTGKAISYTGKITMSGSAGVMTLAYYSDKACAKAVAVSKVKNAGTYYVRATLAADANHKAATSRAAKLTVAKAAQPMKLKAVKRTAKASKLRKKAVTVSKPLKFTKKAQGKVTYVKVAKGSDKCLTVNKKTGKVTVKQGTKKGTYKIKIKVTAKGNKNYKSGSKTVTCKVVVK